MRPTLSETERKMLRLLLDSEGSVSSDELSRQFDVSTHSIQEHRKRLEETCLIRQYSLDSNEIRVETNRPPHLY